MNKNEKNPLPAKKNTSPANAGAPNPSAKGTKGNPWTGEDAPENKPDRAGQWLQLGNGKLLQFSPEGNGPQGNWRGTPSGGGENSGTSRRFNATRLNLQAKEFSALLLPKVDDGTPGTTLFAENLQARRAKAEMGLSLLQTLMDKVKIDLPGAEAKKVTRPRTTAEMAALLAECNGDFASFSAKMVAVPQITEEIPATTGGRVTLAELANQGAAFVPAGAQSEIRRAVMEAVNTAFEAMSA